MTVEDARAFFAGLELSPIEHTIGKDIFREIAGRLSFLEDVGVGYLSLDRRAPTLSGGESQRIRLASQVGSGLQGVLYILDEPSIGLHQTDNRKLIHTLQRLRDVGNSVIVVEHDLETILAADHVVDLGPGAGSEGGRILAQGGVADLVAAPESLSGQYLSGKLEIPVPARRRKPGRKTLTVYGARRHNLDNLTVKVPLGLFVAVTGVSGSGKSTLVHDILRGALAAHVAGRPLAGGDFRRITGLQHLDKVIEIDQSPIGRTPRSNPATYTKLFDVIRSLFSQVPESRIRGYKPGRFSFNVKGGRCETCQGAGVRTVEMQFLSNVEVVCEECGGKRFNEETLQILYKGRTIYEVLEMTVVQAAAAFSNVPAAARILVTLQDVGLGYIRLGQPSTTLSGGEAQRVKLASELRKRGTGSTLYLLDEPTTGLHFHDIRNLLACLDTLVDQGNTVLVIEHNLDVIKVADHVIDLGPGGGKYGGKLVATGTPEQVAANADSLTGQVLAQALRPPAPLPAGPANPGARNGKRDLHVRGAEQNNLQHVDVTIPRNSLTVITGVSGSGKTSLAFDTIFAEGQARYVESLSTYARRFLGRLDKARVDSLEGLTPAIAIDQKSSGRSPRSTVATVTEIYDYLRLLYARIGVPYCPDCGERLTGYSPTRLARELLARRNGERAGERKGERVGERKGERILVLAPLYRPGSRRAAMLDKPEHLPQLARELLAEGYHRVRLGNKMVE
ncbi:MAG: excinuclease ABC subunit UvrA, partial [bacterium]